MIKAPPAIQERTHGRAELKIKLEVDTDPPGQFNTETIQILVPISFSVNTYTQPDLFAGKISAVLCRNWQSRVKGRDWYDFLWFVQRGVPIGMQHLEQRLRAVGFYNDPQPLTPVKVSQMLRDRTQEVSLSQAREDIVKFIKDPRRLDGWSEQTFLHAIDRMQFKLAGLEAVL